MIARIREHKITVTVDHRPTSQRHRYQTQMLGDETLQVADAVTTRRDLEAVTPP